MTAIVLGLLLVTQPLSSSQRPDPKAIQAVEALERHWLEVEGDPAALDEILADDFLHVLAAGIITKSEQLAFMRSHPAPKDGTTRRFQDLRVRVLGTAAVATGIVVATARDGTITRTAFTDVFAYRDARWRAVNAQETPLESTRAPKS